MIAAAYFTKRDASTYTARSQRAIDYARARGELPFYKIGARKIVFARADLDAWMSTSRVDVSEAIAGRA